MRSQRCQRRASVSFSSPSGRARGGLINVVIVADAGCPASLHRIFTNSIPSAKPSIRTIPAMNHTTRDRNLGTLSIGTSAPRRDEQRGPSSESHHCSSLRS
jgi:hypothetical protein